VTVKNNSNKNPEKKYHSFHKNGFQKTLFNIDNDSTFLNRKSAY